MPLLSTMSRRTLFLFALALALAAAAGCKSSAPAPASAAAPVAEAVVQPGAPGQDSTVLADNKVPAFHDPDYTADDVAFMQGMIHH
ncbi:MAG: hypothetical protein ACRD1E_10795, partial [Terriglobales bacterium]